MWGTRQRLLVDVAQSQVRWGEHGPPDLWVLSGQRFGGGDQMVNLGAVLFYGAHADAGDGQ